MNNSRIVISWVLLVFFACGTLCAQEAQQRKMALAAGADTAAPARSAGPVPVTFAERNPRYRINRSDVLVISFPLSPEFDQKVMVQPDGYISLQSAGSINILGLTVPQTVEAIKGAYGKTLHEPIVDVDLTDFQKAYFIVTGQVTKPGQYDLRYDLTVAEAIALAGGFLPTAKTRVYLYHRSTAGWVEARELKLSDFLHGKNVEEDVGIQPGDMIFVPEKAITKIRKYIPYGFGIGTGVYIPG
jgi:protein involved in polysaccharide export with SLBB domain